MLSWSFSRLPKPRPSRGRGWQPPGLEVVAHGGLGVTIPANSHGYGGRSHSLWYCDAQEAGRFQWFETAFMLSAFSRNVTSRRSSRAPAARVGQRRRGAGHAVPGGPRTRNLRHGPDAGRPALIRVLPRRTCRLAARPESGHLHRQSVLPGLWSRFVPPAEHTKHPRQYLTCRNMPQ
jgi:hypothetical protein